MRLLRKIFIGLALCCITFMQVACFGSFPLIGRVYDFNRNIGSNDPGGRLIESLVFWVLMIVPVYALAGTVDILIFNLIEFWGGDSPLSMNSVQQEKQIVQQGGEHFEITATKNMFHIVQLTGTEKGSEVNLVYVPTHKRWYKVRNGIAQVLPEDSFPNLKKAS